MKKVICALLILSVAAFATERVGGTGNTNPWSGNGTYTVVAALAGGLASSYGLAIQDDVSNSMWIVNWGDIENYEFDMVSGDPTGNSWTIGGDPAPDADDQAYCEYGTGNQFFITDYGTPFFAVYEDDGTWIHNIDGPASYTNLFGIGAGNGYLYVGSPNEDMIAWGAYTGVESSITWSEMAYSSIYGLAVWNSYLFVATGDSGVDNLFIHAITGDGSPNPTPEWSCMFTEEAAPNGGIDYDGTYLYVYPQNTFVYVLDIDWVGALESTTWGDIKTVF